MSGRTSKLKWHRIYYVLAVFDVVVVLMGLYLTHQIIDIFHESVSTNLEWEQRLDHYLELGQIAADLNAPGNNIFKTHQIEVENARLQVARQRFQEKLDVLRADLRSNLPLDLATLLLKDVYTIELAKIEMVIEAERIFSLFRREQIDEASVHMAEMDRKYFVLNETISSVHKNVSVIQRQLFAKQQNTISSLQQFEFVIASFVLVMISLAALYGHRIRKNSETMEQEREQHVANLQVTEAALQQANDVLERKVLERTTELYDSNLDLQVEIRERLQVEEELRKAKDVAESANQAKSVFLSTMTHELRTPMNGVLGMTNLLLDTTLNEEQTDIVKTILSSGDTLLTLINNILDFSKIEADKLELEKVDFNLRQFIEESLDQVAPQATQKGLELMYWIEQGVPLQIYQDANRIRQILTNLLANAIKFSETGEIVVNVNAQQQTDSSIVLQFSIQDHGIGIQAEQLERLFQSFNQLDSSISRRYDGAGLGLAISKRLVELMHGRIWVESEFGTGSTFYFTVEAQVLAPNMVNPDLQSSDFDNRRVLIVEESATIRRLLEHNLQKWKARISFPETLDVTAIVKEIHSYDMLIVDSKLSTIDVRHLLEETSRVASQTPVIVLVPIGERLPGELRSASLKTVNKPIHMSQLYDAMISLFQVKSVNTHKIAQKTILDITPVHDKPLKILLAEDNIVNQKVCVGLLGKHGYCVDIAANGLEVLDAISKQAYDLILMDINMPEMDGITATRTIRKNWSGSQQPYIIALTANAMRDDYDQCIAAGMNDYLSKPIRIVELTTALSRIPTCSV